MKKELRRMKKIVRLMNIMVPMYRNNNMNMSDSGGYKVKKNKSYNLIYFKYFFY